MDNFSSPITPIAAPVPAPAPAPVAPPAGAPIPSMAEGGPIGSPAPAKSFGRFFDGITLLDVAIVALVSLSLYYSIFYSRTGIRYFQNMQKQTNSDIAALKAQVAALTPAAGG